MWHEDIQDDPHEARPKCADSPEIIKKVKNIGSLAYEGS